MLSGYHPIRHAAAGVPIEQPLQALTQWAQNSWWKFAIFAIVLVFGLLLASLITRLIGHHLLKSRLDQSVSYFLISILRHGLRVLVILFSLYPFGVTIFTVLSILAAAGIGLTIGLKQPITDFASGVQLLITKTFSVGDYIVINDVEGTVISLDMMHTVLETPTNQKVIIPNHTVSGGVLTNYTKLKYRRATIDFRSHGGKYINQIREIALQICAATEGVVEDPSPVFVVLGMDGDDLLCSLRFHTKAEEYWFAFWEVNEALANALCEANIKVPFQQKVIHLHPKKP